MLFQVGDEPPCPLGGVDGAGPGLLEVVQGGASIKQGVADPADPGEDQPDVEAGLPGPVDVSPSFFMPNGLLKVAQRLAGVTGPHIDDAELILSVCASLVVVGGGETKGLLIVAQCDV